MFLKAQCNEIKTEQKSKNHQKFLNKKIYKKSNHP